MTLMAHPDDVLIVAALAERSEHPQFTDRQIITLDNTTRARGRRIRRAWVSDPALYSEKIRNVYADLAPSMVYDRGYWGDRVASVTEWKPEPQTLVDQIRALPGLRATLTDEDHQAYTLAIQDVLSLLGGLSGAPASNVDIETEEVVL